MQLLQMLMQKMQGGQQGGQPQGQPGGQPQGQPGQQPAPQAQMNPASLLAFLTSLKQGGAGQSPPVSDSATQVGQQSPQALMGLLMQMLQQAQAQKQQQQPQGQAQQQPQPAGQLQQLLKQLGVGPR
jgi:hypothetical protein